jgi:hypothetical protein
MHLPFPDREVHGFDRSGEPRRIAIAGVEDASPHDLRLQQYADDLASDLREHLPHRAGSASVEGTATLDFWTGDVAILTVVEDLEPQDDWDSQRAAVDHRREEVRAWATETIDRQPLWLHLLCVIVAPPHESLDDIASTLTGDGTRVELNSFPGVVFRLGLDACVAVPDDDLQVALGAARLVAAHTAVWAQAAELDRQLLSALADSSAGRNMTINELERSAEELLETYGRVRTFRAPLDNAAVHLSELDGPLWTGVAERWGLDAQLSALNGRIEALEHVHAGLLDTLTARRARRLEKTALVFTLLSAITAVLTVIEFADAPRLGLKLALVASMIAVAAVVWVRLTRSDERADRPSVE